MSLNEIGDSALRSRLVRHGEVPNSVTLRDVADAVDQALREHFECSSDPTFSMQVGPRLHKAEPVALFETIERHANVSGRLAVSIGTVILRDHNDDGFHNRFRRYSNKTALVADLASFWDRFHGDAFEAGRFGSTSCDQYMAWTMDQIVRRAPGAIRSVDVGTRIFRARVWRDDGFHAELSDNPRRSMGAPQPGRARAGRANPERVPCFYGAFERDTCASEMRPAAGWMLVTAEFEIRKPIQALDLTRLDSLECETSIFSDSYQADRREVGLLRGIGAEFSAPAAPDDEPVHYLASQYFAEYVRRKHEPTVHALIYASTQQAGGRNVVVFGGPELTDDEGPLRYVAFHAERVDSIEVRRQSIDIGLATTTRDPV